MNLSQSIPNFVGGVSQQPDLLRLPTQVDTAVNVEFSATDGAAKRQGTRHVARAATTELAGYSMFPLDRDDDQYLVLVGPSDLKVINTAGTSFPIRNTLNSGGGYAASFTYLSGATKDRIRVQPIVDTMFVSNAAVTVTGATGAAAAAWVQAGEAGVFIRQANYSIDYSITFKLASMGSAQTVTFRTDSARSWDPPSGAFPTVTVTSNGQTVFTVPSSVHPFNSVSDLSFTVGSGTGVPIADNFREIPNSETTIEYIGSPAWTAGDTFNVSRTGAVVRSHRIRTNYVARRLREAITALSIAGLSIEGGDNDSSFRLYSTSAFEVFEVKDSAGNTYMTGWTDSINSLSSLPTVWKDGAVVRVAGGTPETSDDYYAKFTIDEGTAGSFGKGRWSETALPVTNEGALTASTMPHVLIRSQDDGSGTFTGTANAIFFDWRPATWAQRQAGDSESNPVPSFVGKKIQDIFWWGNRLGILAGSNIILSEAGQQDNFWRTTVISLPDSDPIDIASTEDEGATLVHAVPMDTRLFVFSAQSQLVVTGQPFISPRTIEAPVVSKFQALPNLQPALVGRALYFGFPSAGFAGVRAFIPGGDALQFGDVDITAAIPRYIPTGSGRILGYPGRLFVHTAARTMAVYHYLEAGGEIVMAAWGSYSFGRDVVDATIIDDRLYLLTAHATDTFLEYIDLAAGQQSSNSINVDRLIDQDDIGGGSITYNIADDETTFLLPYAFENGDEIVVIDQESKGTAQIVSRDHTTSTVTVLGDWTSKDVWVGQTYMLHIRLNRMTVSLPANRGRVSTKGGSTTVRSLSLHLNNTGYIEAQVAYRGSSTYTYPFTGGELGTIGVGSELDDFLDPGDVVRDGTLEVEVHADPRNFRIDLYNGSHLPSNLVSGEWTLRHLRRTRLG